MLVLGAGLLPLLRLAHTRRELLTRLPLAYAVGHRGRRDPRRATSRCCTSRSGWIGLPLLAAVSLVLGLRRLRERGARGAAAPARPAGRRRRSRCSASRRRSRPGGAALRGQAAARVGRLGDLGDAGAGALRVRPPGRAGLHRPAYPALQHPLLLPGARGGRRSASWAASTARSSTSSCSASRSRSSAARGCCCASTRRRLLLAAALLAVVTAPTFFNQLQTNFADIPLAMFDRARRRRARRLAAQRRSRAAAGGGALPRRGRADEERGRAVRARRVRRRGRCRARAAAAAARLGGAGDVRDRPARGGSGCRLHGREDRPSTRSPTSSTRPTSTTTATASARRRASCCAQIVATSRAGATSCRSSSSASRARSLLRRWRLALFGAAGSLLSFAGPARDLLDLDQPDREPPLQLVRPHDRHARDRAALLVPVLLAPEREPEPVEALTRPTPWPRGRTVSAMSGSRPISSRAREGSVCSAASADSQM